MTERQNSEWKRSWQDEYRTHKAGYIDSWGRGIEKITNTCTEHGCPRPTFVITPTGVLVTLAPKFSMAPQVTHQETQQVGTKSELSADPVTGSKGHQSPTQVGPSEAHEDQVAAPVTAPVTAPVGIGDYVWKLLRLLHTEGPMSNKQILEAFELKNRRRLRDTYITPALDEGLIELTIPEKPTSRLQKSRLTENGANTIKGSSR